MLIAFLRDSTATCLFVGGFDIIIVIYITHYLHFILETSPVQFFRCHVDEEVFQWEACSETRNWDTSDSQEKSWWCIKAPISRQTGICILPA